MTVIPCGTLLPMKDHCNDIQLYTPLTIHVVSINANDGLTKTYSPYVTLYSLKDHCIDIKLYIHFTLLVASIDSTALFF